VIRSLGTPADRARTFRAMSGARHREAVDALRAGDWDRYLELLRDVDQLDEQARTEELRAARLEEALRARAATVRAIDRILDLAGRSETREGA
jgi:hypothetical protein